MSHTTRDTNRKGIFFYFLTITTCLVASALLLIELYLIKKGATLCPTSACEIVAKYVKVGEPMLLAIGACFFLVLGGAVFFASRHKDNRWMAMVPLLLLAGASSFDGALIGFQITTIAQKCVICLGVAFSLVILSLFYAASVKRWDFAFLCITAWLAGFMANSILIMPDVTTAHSGMVFYERPGQEKTKPITTATFIFSMECSHCTEVLKYLAEKNPKDTNWRFAITDNSKISINKLGHFFENAAKSKNPFQLLLESKEKITKMDAAILSKFPDLTRQARIFLANNGIKGVPLLIVDKEKESTTFYKGSGPILKYFKKAN